LKTKEKQGKIVVFDGELLVSYLRSPWHISPCLASSRGVLDRQVPVVWWECDNYERRGVKRPPSSVVPRFQKKLTRRV